PLLVDEVDTFRLITSADSRWAASSNVVRVRVEVSKNTLHTVLPRSSGTFFTARAPTSRNESAVSRMSVSNSRGKSSRDRTWRSRPGELSGSGHWGAGGSRAGGLSWRRGRGAQAPGARGRAIFPVPRVPATG